MRKVFEKKEYVFFCFLFEQSVRQPLQSATPPHWETPPMAVRAIPGSTRRRIARRLPNQIQIVFGPAPPLLSQAWSLSPPLFTLTRGIQGCPKIISLDKNTWHPTFEKSFQSSFFLPLGVRTFLQHLSPKMLSLLHHSVTRESFPALSFVAVFSPFLNECQLFMPKDFLEPPCLTLLGVSLVLWERVEGGNR